MLRSALFLLITGSIYAPSATLSFTCLTENSGTCQTGVAPYFEVQINDAGGGQVQFLFSNSMPSAGRIFTVYLDEGSTNYFSAFSIFPTAGTDFEITTSGTLPGGNPAPYLFTTDHGANKDGGAPNGVDPGEFLDLRGTLNSGITFANVVAGLALSPTDVQSLRIGAHIGSLPEDKSEGLIASAHVPEPGTWTMLAIGLGGVALLLRRRRF
jgi:hypothetical protein